MVGGTVVEICEFEGKYWVNVRDNRDECAIFVEKNEDSDKVEIGDGLWWQGRDAFWTPQDFKGASEKGMSGGVHYDIKIPRIGYSGVPHPYWEPNEMEDWP